jgi:Mrp family chromosome partitioning ATPase
MVANMNNQPAFPLHNHGAQTLGLHVTGMTLRDYFAAKAMQAFLSDSDWRVDMGIDDTAYGAYKVADAMLKARDD